jgi:hypothetical protein
MAILALPKGGQALVREGSRVDGATILAVRSDHVRLQSPNGVIELSLAGAGSSEPASVSTVVLESATDDLNAVYVRDVSVDQLSRRLDGQATGKATAGASGGADRDVAAQRIAAAIDLPAGSRILAVSGQSVGSADAAIRAIESAFAAGREGVILDIQSPNGPGRAYINRARP